MGAWVRQANADELGGGKPDAPLLTQGDRLFRIGERPRAMFHVIKGEIRLTRSSRGGAEMILQRTRSGFLAEASVEATTYRCDVLAIKSSVILRFPMAKFRIALEDEKIFRKAWISLLAREVRGARARCEWLTLQKAAERVLHFLENEGQHGFVTLEQSRKACPQRADFHTKRYIEPWLV